MLLPVRSVGVMGDERTYENVVALRAVTSTDGMTADWYPFPHDVLARISNRIINEVRRRESRRVRRQLQAAGDDRVGIGQVREGHTTMVCPSPVRRPFPSAARGTASAR